MRLRPSLLVALALELSASAAAVAQSYRARVDGRAQVVSFRGLAVDSIPVGQAVPTGGGGLRTPDGHAVRCGAGDYCFFFRPGPVLRGVPASTSASVTMWGLGVQGLTLRATGRLVGDVGRDDVWPGDDPAAQLLEGYLEYRWSTFVARGGRQLATSRLEPLGFDGAWLRYRWDAASLELTGYGGWGLGQAAIVPVASQALNPLDEWRPRDRQLVGGLEAAWLWKTLDARGEYRREVDPQGGHIVSERTSLSLGMPVGPLRATGGVDYNLAEGDVGNADLTVAYLRRRYSISAGARRYRPYFSLWTLWSAFSPVPHHALHVAGDVRATDRLALRGRVEAYRYDDADVSTALVPQLEDGGWRARIGGALTLDPHWTIDADGGVERGPGASGRFGDLAITWAPNARYSVDLYGGAVDRPLELRYFDAQSRWIGGRAEALIGSQRRLWGDVAYVDDDRDRPDASATSLGQFRLRTGFSVSFGTAADRVPLPPGRPRSR